MDIEAVTVGSRTCPSCGVTKHVLAFAACKRSKDGLYWRCRECESVYQLKRSSQGRARRAITNRAVISWLRTGR